MEAHECIVQCIVELILNLLVVKLCWYSIVNIKKSCSILRYNCSDELTECSVDINLTGYRDSSACETAVNVAWNEAELCLECRPALSGNGNELSVASVCLYSVKKCKLILCKLCKNLRLLVACAKLCLHILDNLRDSLIACMLIEALEKVKL